LDWVLGFGWASGFGWSFRNPLLILTELKNSVILMIVFSGLFAEL